MTDVVAALLARQIKGDKDVVGHLSRIYCASYDNCLILIFEDGRWAHYCARVDYDGGETIEFESDRPEWAELFRAGLMTNDEYDTQLALERKELDQTRQQHELETLAKLKAKYG